MGSNRKSAYLHKQDEWKALYEAGESFRSIAEKEGLYYRTVQGVLKGIVEPRPKRTYDHLIDEWVEAYVVKEMNAQEISEAYGVDGVTVGKYLREAGVEIRNSRNRVSPFVDDIPVWVKRYEAGDTLLAIAQDYGCCAQTVHKHIHKKVTMRHYAETSQTHDIARPDYFEHIDSREKAYWLGVWFGTGFIATTPLSRECTLVTGVSELKTVERFKEVIGYTKNIRVIKKGKAEVARLRIHNKQFAHSLETNGLLPGKGDNLKFPGHIEKDYLSSFLLGYVEGKGSCYNQIHRKKEAEYYQLFLYIFGTEEFLSHVKDIFRTELGIDADIKEVKKRGAVQGSRYEIRLSRLKELEKIIEWLYRDVTVYSDARDIRKALAVRKQHSRRP